MRDKDSNRVRDIVLIGGFALMALVFLLPPMGGDDASSTKAEVALRGSALQGADAGEDGDSDTVLPEMGASSPTDGIPHRYWPLTVGSIWRYRVDGPPELVGGQSWTIEVVSLPTEEEPGKLIAGYDDNRLPASFWFEGEDIHTDVWPLTEPVDFMHNKVEEAGGAFLPNPDLIGKGVVWEETLRRKVVHQIKDVRGRFRQSPALAIQTNRANVDMYEDITVPAGRFQSYGIKWISRVAIEVDNRPVLLDLTSKPYRNETMWVARGIGVVRRNIVYPGYKGAKISFSMDLYHRPPLK